MDGYRLLAFSIGRFQLTDMNQAPVFYTKASIDNSAAIVAYKHLTTEVPKRAVGSASQVDRYMKQKCKLNTKIEIRCCILSDATSDVNDEENVG